jgi:hypothetical protein
MRLPLKQIHIIRGKISTLSGEQRLMTQAL